MSNFIQLMTFIFAILTPLIALYAELSNDTPSTIFHTLVRSVICIVCLISASYFMMPTYTGNLFHMAIFLLVFGVSFFKLYIEKVGMNLGKFFQHIIH